MPGTSSYCSRACSAECGTRPTPTGTSRRYSPASKPSGSDGVTSHTFRKTVATRVDEAGLSAHAIVDHLGHAKPSMTQDVYMGRGVASARAAEILDSGQA
ncbi:hypothetical protein E1264_22455 [Actinomadura sp. KC216]|nr:hypothetical protein E1264_22455 [Actinomadura sp. KC216]